MSTVLHDSFAKPFSLVTSKSWCKDCYFVSSCSEHISVLKNVETMLSFFVGLLRCQSESKTLDILSFVN